MKKALVAAILGVATVASTYGQGHVIFSTYVGSAYQPVTYKGGALDGTIASTGFSAQLYYALGSGQSFGSMTAVAGSITGLNTTTAPGYVTGGDVIIPNYVSGAITFAVVAFNGTQWDPTFSGAFGNSYETKPADVATWTETSIPALANPTDVFQQNVPAIFVSAVPEPTTFTLAGLGAAAMLIFRRRR